MTEFHAIELAFGKVRKMKIVSKTALLAVSALGVSIYPAFAGTISSPADGTPITATGVIVMDVANIPATIETCSVSVSGFVNSSGSSDKMTFTSGSLNCPSGNEIDLPFSIDASSSSSVSFDPFTLNTPIGMCGSAGFSLSWSGSTASRLTTIAIGPCNFRYVSLAVSPTVTIL